MEWIDVKDKHFAQIEQKGNTYKWESIIIDEPFLVAVPTNKGWDIEKVVLTDEIGLQLFYDGETECYGWEMTDVTHWMKIENPYKLQVMTPEEEIYKALDDKRMMQHIKSEGIWHLYRKQMTEYLFENFNITPKL